MDDSTGEFRSYNLLEEYDHGAHEDNEDHEDFKHINLPDLRYLRALRGKKLLLI